MKMTDVVHLNVTFKGYMFSYAIRRPMLFLVFILHRIYVSEVIVLPSSNSVSYTSH